MKPCLPVRLARQHGYRHLHIAIKPIEDRHQPVDGEALELGLTDARKIGCGDAGDLLGRTHRQIVGRQRLADLGRQDRAELALFGFFHTKVGIDVAGASDHLDTARVDASYIYNQTWSAGAGLFDIRGDQDPLQYGPGAFYGSAGASPDTRGYLLQFALLERGEAGVVSSWIFAVPVLAAIYGVLLFDEPMSPGLVAGVAAVAAGILLVTVPPRAIAPRTLAPPA